MGYTTDFHGSLSIEPPLCHEEITYLRAFSASRRMDRQNGPFFVDDDDSGFLSGSKGKNSKITDVINNNSPPAGQPSLWCQWTCNDDGTAIEWDGGEKFYAAAEWMAYLRTYFLTRCAAKDLAPESMDFLQPHRLSGAIHAVGEDSFNDVWKIKADGEGIHVSRGAWTDLALQELFGQKLDGEDEEEDDHDYISSEQAIEDVTREGYVAWGPWEKVPDFDNPAEESRVLALSEKRILDGAAASPQASSISSLSL